MSSLGWVSLDTGWPKWATWPEMTDNVNLVLTGVCSNKKRWIEVKVRTCGGRERERDRERARERQTKRETERGRVTESEWVSVWASFHGGLLDTAVLETSLINTKCSNCCGRDPVTDVIPSEASDSGGLLLTADVIQADCYTNGINKDKITILKHWMFILFVWLTLSSHSFYQRENMVCMWNANVIFVNFEEKKFNLIKSLQMFPIFLAFCWDVT